MRRENLYDLMYEAQELFGIEFDAQPAPVLEFEANKFGERIWQVDLDPPEQPLPYDPKNSAQAFTIWLRCANFERHRHEAASCIRHVLEANPFTTLQVVLEPSPQSNPSAIPQSLGPDTLAFFFAACQVQPTYLDRYYALQPGCPNGAKRLIVVLPMEARSELHPDWLAEVENQVTLVWRDSRQEPGRSTVQEREVVERISNPSI
jgi:hypothetical protein